MGKRALGDASSSHYTNSFAHEEILKYTINISILVEYLNYLFMGILCLHQGRIS